MSINNLQKKQKMLLFGGGALLLAIAWGFASLTGSSKPHKKETNDISATHLVNPNNLTKSRWMGQAATQIDVTDQQLTNTQKQNKILKNQLNKIQAELKNLQIKKDQSTQTKNPPLNQRYNFFHHNDQSTASSLYTKYPMPRSSNAFKSFSIKPKKNKKIVVYTQLQNSLSVSVTKNAQVIKKKSQKIKPNDDILPTGSITRVELLSGFDAPTMAQAKENPLPILMKVLNLSILPNHYRYNLKECFVIGQGYGDLSSQRVYIRTNDISCVTKDGQHIDMPFKAMVSGEDGKLGLRGRVVTKQGALIARSLIAGFLNGVSKAFNQTQQYTIMGGGGTTSGIKQMSTPESLKYGAFGGFSEATNKLASFYLKMADQISPVIEINAGRIVDLISTGMENFKTVESKQRSKK